jgi:Fe-S-cluster-containing dehydrogenase component
MCEGFRPFDVPEQKMLDIVELVSICTECTERFDEEGTTVYHPACIDDATDGARSWGAVEVQMATIKRRIK